MSLINDASLQKLFSDAQKEAQQLEATLRAIKSHPGARTVIVETGDDTEILANECEHILMFIEGINDWEVQ